MSSSSSTQSGHGAAIASSSRTPPSTSPAEDDSDDGLDIGREELLADDPLHSNGFPSDRPVFVRSNSRPLSPSLAARLLPSPFLARHVTPPSPLIPNRIGRAPTPNTILSYLHTPADPASGLQDAKDGGVDWYVEGPGRRVGYDDLTAIDWIYEYSKERTRLQQLTQNSPGVLGQAKLLVDSSQMWWVLAATGLAVGAIAAGIDIVRASTTL